MIRDIEINPVKLARHCDGVPEGSELKLVIQDLVDTAKHWQAMPNGCAGLAAPQIGYPCRIIVIYYEGRYMPLVDPVITQTGRDKITKVEGCLSRPNIKVRKKRHKKIRVKYLDEAGELIERGFTRMNARVIQHEIDHLQGITI